MFQAQVTALVQPQSWGPGHDHGMNDEGKWWLYHQGP